MGFFKTASTPILGVYQSSGKFHKCAAQNMDIPKGDDELVKRSLNLLSKDLISAVAKVYNLSPNIDDYVFPIPRAVTADEPNANGDRFTDDELTRFSNLHRCQVYQTFRNDPLHIEHVAFDPKAARGFLPDVYYTLADPNDKHVLVVAAVDTTKDVPFATGILDGSINKFSMGCTCEAVKCSYSKCESPIAYSDDEMCDHLKWHKMSHIDGELIFEDCLGVEFSELSGVGDPADPKAITQMMLSASKRNASLRVASKTALDSLISNRTDQETIARYFKQNIGNMPDAMVQFANKLF